MGAEVKQVTAEIHLGDAGQALGLLGRVGFLRHGHFRLLSGLHSDRFFAFSAIASDQSALDAVGRWLQPTVAAWSPSGFLAPSTAGVGLAATLARGYGAPLHLAQMDGRGRPAGIVGGPALDGQRVVLVNDVVTTGGSFDGMARLVREQGGTIAGAAWFASRSRCDVAQIVGGPTASVATALLPAWPEGECDLCSSAEPIEDALDLN